MWTAIALHTTPGISQLMHPDIALVTAGVEMDVLGIDYENFGGRHHPRFALEGVKSSGSPTMLWHGTCW